MATVELVLDTGCDLGESPVWDERSQRLYFVDINSCRIHAYTPGDGSHVTIDLEEPVGCVVPTSNPDFLLAATSRDVVEVDVLLRTAGQVLATTPAEHGIDDMRFNDGKVSPQGSLVVGRMHSKWRDGQRGRLYRLDPGSSELVEVMQPEEVLLPNGMAWDTAKGVMYFVDSGAETIVACATDAQGVPRRGLDGSLVQRTVSSRPTGHKNVPDGMTIDAEGNLWVALGESGAVVCYDPGTGAELRRVALPVQRPTACTFGGRDLGDLYVTTRAESGEGASANHGGLFRVQVPGVKGAAAAAAYPLSPEQL